MAASGASQANGTPNKVTGELQTGKAEKPPEKCSCPNPPRSSERLDELEKRRAPMGDGGAKQLDELIPSGSWQKAAQQKIDGIRTEPSADSANQGTLSRAAGAYASMRAGEARAVLGFANRLVFGAVDLVKMAAVHNPMNPMNPMRDGLDAAILAEHMRLGNTCSVCMKQAATAVGAELVKPVTDPWKRGEYTEAATTAVLEVGALVGPVLAKLGSMRTAAAAARAAEATKVAEAAQAQKALEAANATKAAEATKAGQAPKTAAIAQAKPAASGKDGVAIKAKTKAEAANKKSGGAADDAKGASKEDVAAGTKENAAANGERGTGAADDAARAEQQAAASAEGSAGAQNKAAAADEAAEAGQATRQPETVCTAERTCVSDPIDVVTGQMVMQHTDVSLPATLALELQRVHISGYDAGRLFGREWASSWDQRLVVGPDTVTFIADDGMRLPFPLPTSERPTAPQHVPNLSLRRTASGFALDRRSGVTLWFETVAAGEARLAAITERKDQRSSQRIDLSYDATGTLTQVSHSGGYRVRVRSEQGRIVALHLVDPSDSREHLLARYQYSDNGFGSRLQRHATDGGSALTYGYDAAGRVIHWEDRRGTWYGYRYDERGRCVATTGVDGIFSDRFHYDPERRTTVYTDALGHSSTYHYNALLQVTRVVDPSGAVTQTERDAYGRLLREVDPLGRATRHAYDPAGNLATVERADGSRYVFEYDERGLCTRIVDPAGAAWTRRYDEHGVPVQTTQPDGSSFRLSDDGRVQRVTDPAGAVTAIETDARGLVVASTDGLGSSTRLMRDAFGRVVARTDATGKTERFAYTPTGKMTQAVDASGAAQTWTFDAEGVLAEHVDALGRRTRIESGWFDRPKAVTGPDGGTIRCEYDALLQLSRVTDALDRHWTYERDALGRVIAETDFNARRIAYAYDPAGQCVAQTDALGTLTRFEHDKLGRVIARHAPDGSAHFEHDAMGRLISARNADAEVAFKRDVLGRIVEEACNGRAVQSAYDAAGRRTLRRIVGNGHGESDAPPCDSLWTYDASGLPQTLSLPGDDVFRFTHDARGLQTERRFVARAGELRLSQRFDTGGRLVQQSTLSRRQGTERLIQQRDWSYDPAGELQQIADLRFGVTRYARDAAGRVTQVATPRGNEQFAYDLTGQVIDAARHKAQLTSATTQRLTQGPRRYEGTRLKRAGEVTYEHDAQGRVIERRLALSLGAAKVWRYAWDSNDRLRHVTTPDGSEWRYAYDALGRRVGKAQWATLDTVDGPQSRELQGTYFIWDGANVAREIRTERKYHRDGSEAEYRRKTTATTWEWEPRSFRPLAKTVAQTERGYTQNSRHAVVNDAIGTPCELVSADSTVAWQARGTLWGELDDERISDADCPWGFQGQYRDDETGLAYNFHRYYDPATGRYQSSDPIQMAGGLDPHGYVADPTGWVDPFGLASCPESLGTLNRAMKTENGSLIQSPMDGAPNSNQLGARTLGSNPKHWDMPVSGADDMVGPSYTGSQGLSASLQPMPLRPGQVNATVEVVSLPKGLGALNDHGTHVSIFPADDMTFGTFQRLLNQSVPWSW